MDDYFLGDAGFNIDPVVKKIEKMLLEDYKYRVTLKGLTLRGHIGDGKAVEYGYTVFD